MVTPTALMLLMTANGVVHATSLFVALVCLFRRGRRGMLALLAALAPACWSAGLGYLWTWRPCFT